MSASPALRSQTSLSNTGTTSSSQTSSSHRASRTSLTAPASAASHPPGAAAAAAASADADAGGIPLDALVRHLLAAKRSLTSITAVWRANELVTSARVTLEDAVGLRARSVFLRHGISNQYHLLKQVRGGIERTYDDGQREFRDVIRTLDAANARLETTMDTLRATMVEAAFRPANEPPRSLLDFVDEQSVESMREGLKGSIRQTRKLQEDFDSSILSFDDDLRTLKAGMTQSVHKSGGGQDGSFLLVTDHIAFLEENALEMANLLQSLTSHFDMCVSAIRHTEGGYAAVRNAAANPPPGTDPVSVSGVMNGSATQSTEMEPLSDVDRIEMLQVLQNDAAEVEDVVLEIRERLSDMEARHELVADFASSVASAYRDTVGMYTHLEGTSARLSSYILAGADFRLHWSSTRARLLEQCADLDATRAFYENYHAGYDGLILEIARRRQAEDKVRAVLSKALDQVAKVVEADRQEREGFRLDVGEFLPADLYPDLNVQMRKLWSPEWIRRMQAGQASGALEAGEEAGAETDAADCSVPILSREVVDAAAKRELDRRKAEEAGE